MVLLHVARVHLEPPPLPALHRAQPAVLEHTPPQELVLVRPALLALALLERLTF